MSCRWFHDFPLDPVHHHGMFVGSSCYRGEEQTFSFIYLDCHLNVGAISIRQHNPNEFISDVSTSLAFASAGSSIAWPAPTLPKILSHEAPISLDVTEITWMVSLLYVGNFISPFPAGYLAEKFGRKKALLIFSILPVLSWLLILFGKSPLILYIARLFAGLSFGLVSTIQPIYVGEIAQPEIRGSLSTFNNLMFGIGGLFTFIIGPFVSYVGLAIIALSIPIAYIGTFIVIPESPYYYIMKKDKQQARDALAWFRGNKNKVDLELELNQIEKDVEIQMQNKSNFSDMFVTKASRKAIIISSCYSALKRLSGADVIQAYATVTLPERTFGILNPSECAIILGITTVVSCFYSVYVADRYGRKPLLIISCFGCGLSMLLTSIWFYLDSKTNLNVQAVNFIPFIGFIVQNITYNLALGPIGATVKGEMFPANVKTKSSALATVILALTSFILNKFYLIIASFEGVYLNFLIFAVSCLAGAAFIIIYVPETKGKTLQEIQDILNGTEKLKITTSVGLQDFRVSAGVPGVSVLHSEKQTF